LAEQIEIVNVGGQDGVASEITLQKLVEAMDRMSGQTNSPSAKAAKEYAAAQKDATGKTKAAGESTKKLGEKADQTRKYFTKLDSAILGAAGGVFGTLKSSVMGLGEAFLGTSTDISSFAQSIPIFGSIFAPFTAYLDNTVQSFRDMSSVGGAFGNDLEAVRMTAYSLHLSLGEFQNLVMNNSESLAQLGGSVTQGIQRFTNMNKIIKGTGDFASLKNMGFTIDEINEGMTDYIAQQAAMGTLQGRSTKSLAAGSANYLKQIDLLAKVTGKSRQEAEKQLRAQAQDAGLRTLLNQFKEGSKEFNNLQMSIALLDEIGGDAGTAMKDLLDGMASTPEAGKFIAMLGDSGPQIQEALKQVGEGADPKVLQEAFRNAGGALEGFANMGAAERKQYIDTLRQSDPAMASFLDASAKMMDIGNRDLDAAKAEQDKRNAITDSLVTFDDKLKEARAEIGKQLIESGLFDKLATLTSDLVTGFGKLVTDEGFKTGISSFMTLMSEGFTAIGEFFTNWKKYDFKTALLGDEEKGVDGLFGDLKGALNKAWETIQPVIMEAFGGLGTAIWDGIKSIFPDWEAIGAGLLVSIGTLFLAPFVGIFGAIALGIAAVIGWDAIKEKADEIWTSITGSFASIKDWWTNLDFSKMLSDTWTSVKSWFSFGDSSFSITQLATDAWATVKGFFSFGDSSFSITQLATDAWATVKGFFSFGGGGEEGGTSFSISQLMTDAWASVTSFFSLENFSIPSISDMFTGIINKVKSFFSFDFKMPNFKQYLPKWLGGEGKSLFGGSDDEISSAAEPPAVPDTSAAVEAGDSVVSAQNAIATFANLDGLKNNLDILKNGLDIQQVRSYTNAMSQLVEVLEQLNEELAKDNKFGPGTGENAGSVLAKMDTIGTGGGVGGEQVNSLLQEILTVLADMREYDRIVASNTRDFPSSNIAVSGLTLPG